MLSIDNFIDSKNRNLYFEVLGKTNLELIESNKWASRTNDNGAQIYYIESSDAISCFTHELLHVKYYHLGLKYLGHTGENNFNPFIEFLFNQLSHHRFFDEFIQLGFEPHSFLNQELEKKAMSEIEEKIFELEKQYRLYEKVDSFELLSIYLTLKSPHDISENAVNFISRLKAIGNEYHFSSIDSILDEWKNGETFDAS